MATAARRASDAASLTYHRERVRKLEAENAMLWNFVENVAHGDRGWASGQAQELVQDREVARSC